MGNNCGNSSRPPLALVTATWFLFPALHPKAKLHRAHCDRSRLTPRGVVCTDSRSQIHGVASSAFFRLPFTLSSMFLTRARPTIAVRRWATTAKCETLLPIACYSHSRTNPKCHYSSLQSKNIETPPKDDDMEKHLGVNHKVDGDFETHHPDAHPPPPNDKGKEEISDREWEIRTGESHFLKLAQGRI